MALNSGLTGARGNTSQGSKELLYESTNSIPMRPSAKPFTPTLGSTSVVKSLVNTPIAANPPSEIASSRDQSITRITPTLTKRNQYADPPDSNEPSNVKEEDGLEDLFVQPLFSQSVPGDSSLSTLPGSLSSTIFLPSILTGSSSLRSTSMPSKAPAQFRQPPSTPFSELYTPTYHNPNIVPPTGNPSAQVVTRKDSFVSSKIAKIWPPVVKETSSPQPTSRTWNNFIPASQPRSSMEVMSSPSVAAPCSSGMDPVSYVSFDFQSFLLNSRLWFATSAYSSCQQASQCLHFYVFCTIDNLV
ncbi:hypothetical protein CPB84DRAFT_1293462 [Gymnopilus junonius]|uniref:Uncharacterized protein n=1 Tax=Gymnopilus junonius TaxID=109634 RepID=A0A9P5TKQ8_GYMJU|nr:hypothetical protein CPB84DRAFT_1293462 [Gymnopilus junonius]